MAKTRTHTSDASIDFVPEKKRRGNVAGL